VEDYLHGLGSFRLKRENDVLAGGWCEHRAPTKTRDRYTDMTPRRLGLMIFDRVLKSANRMRAPAGRRRRAARLSRAHDGKRLEFRSICAEFHNERLSRAA